MNTCHSGACLCADLCQPLREAGRLSLGEGQEKGLLPEWPESWNISKREVKSILFN